MSTHAAIRIIGQNEAVSLYQRTDGYPTWVLRNIANWIDDGGHQENFDVAIEKFEEVHEASFGSVLKSKSSNIAMTHCDVSLDDFGGEWFYQVDLVEKSLKIYCLDGFLNVNHLLSPVDPLIYVSLLIDEAKQGETEVIQNSLKTIEKNGFSINPR